MSPGLAPFTGLRQCVPTPSIDRQLYHKARLPTLQITEAGSLSYLFGHLSGFFWMESEILKGKTKLIF